MIANVKFVVFRLNYINTRLSNLSALFNVKYQDNSAKHHTHPTSNEPTQ